MNWRTDKPTADLIVVYLKDSCYPQVLVYDKDKQSYYEEHGALVNMQDIVKWTPFLEEDEWTTCPQRGETVMDCDDLEEEIERYSKETLAIKFPTTNIECIKADIKHVARHFAKWGAEHLKK